MWLLLANLTPGVHIYNLGTGQGTSVLQLVHTFEEANGIKIPYEIVSRRPGDIAECFADAGKAKRELGWTAKRIYSRCAGMPGTLRRTIKIRSK